MCRIRPQAIGWLGPRLGWVDWGWFLVGVGAGPQCFGGWHFMPCQNHNLCLWMLFF